PGEEDILFAAYARLSARLSAGRDIAEHSAEPLFLVLAPRDIKRGPELVDLAAGFGLEAGLRSRGEEGGQVLILDTLGELAQCYGQADLAFVGGSLVPQGGHNPIEPAVHGVPVLFGPHTEDFSEICDELVRCGGGKRITADSLPETLVALRADKKARTMTGRAAQALVERHRGGVRRHVQAIRGLLAIHNAE
ncbi:MAG: 3-deoxy-D-manno-octulosonic acid transferase, partial [Candidatus Electrothrix sp. AUS1_2]|nr:3-deoxy-D-manno-octulosonic acid transferase [Candidatus Electrothrix sp. AUS1_2]